MIDSTQSNNKYLTLDQFALFFFAVIANLALPALCLADSGGPNNFGYIWSDEVSTSYVDTSQGTPVALDDDNYAGPFPIGFNFNFFGTNVTQVHIASNGMIGLGRESGLTETGNQCPPGFSSPYDVVMLYWDDLNPLQGGEVRYFAGGTAPHRYFAVEFDEVPHYGSSTNTITAQAVFYENVDWILLNYEEVSVEAGSSTTVGIKNSFGGDNLTIGCDSNFLQNQSTFWIGQQGAHNLSTGPGQGSIALSWEDDNLDVDSTIVERSPSEVGPFEEIDEIQPGAWEYLDTDAEECTDYWYRLRGHWGRTIFSPYTNTADYTFPPYAPSDLVVIEVAGDHNGLFWIDNSDCESGFVIHSRIGETGDWMEIASLPPDTAEYTDPVWENRAQIQYRIQAVAPPLVSAWSDIVTSSVKLAAPAALTANAISSKQISLSWQDDSQGEDGFSIEKYDNGIGDFIEIANVAADTTEFRDFNLNSGTEYSYRMRAFSVFTYSAYSETATAQTPSDDSDDDDDSSDDSANPNDDDSDTFAAQSENSDDANGCCG